MVSWCIVLGGRFMAYFLKVAKQQTRTYLSIYESFYSDDVKGTKHRCIKPIGNLEKLKAEGIEDPIAFYKKEVEKMNQERKKNKEIEKAKEKPSKVYCIF